MMKKALCFLLTVLFTFGCLVVPGAATAQEDAAPGGLLLLVAGAENGVEDFLYVSVDSAENQFTLSQLPADQGVAIPFYKTHRLDDTTTLRHAFLLGQGWEGDAAAIDFTAAAVQAGFDLTPEHTLLISGTVVEKILDTLHLSTVSPDPLAALGRILTGLADMDAAAQSQLLAFIAENAVSDTDSSTLSAYLTGLAAALDGNSISLSA